MPESLRNFHLDTQKLVFRDEEGRMGEREDQLFSVQ